MSKHTPGSWAVIPPDEHCKTWFVSRDRLDAPVGVVPEHIDDGLPYYIAVFGALMEAERAEANARLIAAAPELLAALEIIEWECQPEEPYDPQTAPLWYCPWCGSMKQQRHKLDCVRQAAIASVKGE